MKIILVILIVMLMYATASLILNKNFWTKEGILSATGLAVMIVVMVAALLRDEKLPHKCIDQTHLSCDSKCECDGYACDSTQFYNPTNLDYEP